MKRAFVIPLAMALLAGCQTAPSRMNAPPQGYCARPHPMQRSFQAMADNAALQDLSVSDIHFAGNTAQLSGTGVYRLDQLCEALRKCDGGEVRYTTQLTDDRLVHARLERVQSYLAEANCDMHKVTVRLGPPAGDGMRADMAVKAQQAPTTCAPSGTSASEVRPSFPGFGEARK